MLLSVPDIYYVELSLWQFVAGNLFLATCCLAYGGLYVLLYNSTVRGTSQSTYMHIQECLVGSPLTASLGGDIPMCLFRQTYPIQHRSSFVPWEPSLPTEVAHGYVLSQSLARLLLSVA